MPKLLDQVRGSIRTSHHSIRTEQASVNRFKRFVLFDEKRPPLEMGEAEAFFTHRAAQENLPASTQNQDLSASLFLEQVVLARPL